MRLTLVSGLLLPLLLHLLLLEGQNVIVNLLGLGRSSEDFEGVIFKGLDPGTDIGRVLTGIVADSQLVAQDHRGDFGAQLFLGVPLASERMGQVAVKARLMARPMAQLMKGGRIVAVGRGELAFIG